MYGRTIAALALALSVPGGTQQPDDRFVLPEFPPPIGDPIPSPLPPPLKPEHLRLAERLSNLIVISEISEEILEHPPAPEVHGGGRIVARPSARWDVGAAAATAYAQLYTPAELEAMIAFFESPAGQKYLSARRQGVVNVVERFQQLPWYSTLFYEICGGREECRWRPEPPAK